MGSKCMWSRCGRWGQQSRVRTGEKVIKLNICENHAMKDRSSRACTSEAECCACAAWDHRVRMDS